MVKYSEGFNRDFNWYLSVRRSFNFNGSPCKDILYDKNGVDGKEAFFMYDSRGDLLPTRHPNILRSLLKTKGSVNLHIKSWAEDRAKGILPKYEFTGDGKTLEWENGKPVYYPNYKIRFNLPEWVIEAVENQKYKYYSNT